MDTRSKTRALKAVNETSIFYPPVKVKRGKSTMPSVPAEHPLMNLVVLSTIFKHLNKTDLTTCRLVSSSWYDASLPQWRSNVVLTVKPTRGHLDSKYRKFFGAGRPRDNTLPSVTALQKVGRIPYRKIRIRNGLSLEYEGNYFWNTYGSSLRELYLDSCIAIHPTTWKAILFEKTPNLKKLKLGGAWPDLFLRSKKVETEERKYTDLPAAKSRNENLKSLEFDVPFPFDDFPVTPQAFLSFYSKVEDIVIRARQKTEIPKFLKAVKHVIEQDSSNLRLKHLDMLNFDLPLPFENSTMTLLLELGLPLKVLKLDLTLFEGSLSKLGDSLADTLQELIVFRNFGLMEMLWLVPSPFTPFTRPMNTLQVVKFMGSIVRDMGFLQYTKNLTKLHIFEGLLPREYWNKKILKSYRPVLGSDFSDLLTNLGEDHPLRNLVLEHVLEFQTDYYIKASDLSVMKKWFPNLQVFRAPLEYTTGFAQMCFQWRNLRELILDSRSTLCDADIVGTNPGFTLFHRNPNITLLKNLEIFRVEKVAGCASGQFTFISDYSVQQGFMLLPKLKLFEIPVSVKLSRKSLQLLKDKGVTVIISGTEVLCKCLEP